MRKPLKRFPPRKPRDPRVYLGKQDATRESDFKILGNPELKALIEARDAVAIARASLADRRQVKVTARILVDMISNLNRATQSKLYSNRATLARFIWAMSLTGNPGLSGMVVNLLGGSQKPVSLRFRHRLPQVALEYDARGIDAVMTVGLADQIPNKCFQIAERILKLKDYIEARRKRPRGLRGKRGNKPV